MIFLKRIIEDIKGNIINNNSDANINLTDIAFVFPTKRAGIYFKNMLLEDNKNNKPIFEPDIFSINDFIEELSEQYFPDQLTMIFELYKSYKSIIGKNAKSFDKFYAWGKIILSDFNDIDQNLNDNDIFKDLHEYSKSTDESNNQILKNYNEFMLILGDLYSEFKISLGKNGFTYYGLALRNIIKSLNEEKEEFNQLNRWDKIVFAGFNALTRGEEKLFSILKGRNIGLYYWDIDKYFYSDFENEAGNFFRASQLIDKDIKWIDDNLINEQKEIDIIGTPGKVGQAKIIGKLIEKNISDNKSKTIMKPDNTAIILSEESLLFPVLNSIPPNIRDINISMGSPVKDSPVYNFIIFVLTFILKHHDKNEGFQYLFNDIKSLLIHPYIFKDYETNIKEFLEKYETTNILYLYDDNLSELNDKLRQLINYDKINNWSELFTYLTFLINFLKKTLIINDNKIDLEYLFVIHKQFTRIKENFIKYNPDISLKDTFKILQDLFKNAIVPFSGEPLKGLQILGMLETRALDFDNIFILSVNEGIIPKGKTSQSIIPTEIRKQNEMTYYEKRDAIFAYYFYRLIKGAKKVTILYNTEADNFSKGEKSRFIEQLNHEFKAINTKSDVTERLITMKAESSPIKPLEIVKDKVIINKLKTLRYSASALNRFIFCPLSFYFKYITQIQEIQEPETGLEPKSFGTIIHKILESVYKPFIGEEITRENIERIIKELTFTVENHFSNTLQIKNTKNGKNYLNKMLIIKLLEDFFNNELKSTPFIIKALEKELRYSMPLNIEAETVQLKLRGIIDRIDKHDSKLRIIDYKTGMYNNLNNTLNLDSNFDEIIEQVSKSKELLQLSFYNLLMSNDNKYGKNRETKYGIIYFKSLSKGIKLLENNGDTDEISRHIISEILNNILDKTSTFTQTKNKENCKLCPYKNICLLI